MSPGRYLMVSVHVLPSEKSETAPCPSLPRGGRMWLYLAWECSAGVLWFVIVQVFLLHYPAPSFEFTAVDHHTQLSNYLLNSILVFNYLKVTCLSSWRFLPLFVDLYCLLNLGHFTHYLMGSFINAFKYLRDFWDTGLLCKPDWSLIHSSPLILASPGLKLEVCITTPSRVVILKPWYHCDPITAHGFMRCCSLGFSKWVTFLDLCPHPLTLWLSRCWAHTVAHL